MRLIVCWGLCPLIFGTNDIRFRRFGFSRLGCRAWGYSPPQVDRIWLWAYHDKITIYPIFYLLKGGCRVSLLFHINACASEGAPEKRALPLGWLGFLLGQGNSSHKGLSPA